MIDPMRSISQIEASLAEKAATPGQSPDFRALFDQQAAPQSPFAEPVFADFSAPGIEAHMNRWLMGRIQFENDLKTQIYDQALENWKLNDEQRKALGMPALPPPEAPVLAAVAPKPEGWWFE